MTGLELLERAEQENVNPYVLGYVLAEGYSGIEECEQHQQTGGVPFQEWIHRKWRDFKRKLGRRTNYTKKQRVILMCGIIAESMEKKVKKKTKIKKQK